MSKAALTKYLKPMQDFLSTKTQVHRTKVLNKQLHVIALDSVTLTNVGIVKKDHKGFRVFARNWARKYSKKATELGLNDQMQQYIVVDNFTQAGSFFNRAKQERFLEGNAKIHRGHVFAAVREFGSAKLEETLSKLAPKGGKEPAVIANLRRKMQAQLNMATPALRAAYIRNINKSTAKADLSITIIIPELASENLSKKAERDLKRNYDRALKEFVSKHERALMNLTSVQGSKSMMQAVDAVLDATIRSKQVKPYKATTKTKLGKKPKKVKKTKVAVLPRLRDKKGQFTSAASIQNIIQSQVSDKVKENMGEAGALVNRTGRFAESVVITKITQSRQGAITAFYTYMKYPYQTFERGFQQGSTRRDPRLLISRSIREIAAGLVSSKLSIRTRRV